MRALIPPGLVETSGADAAAAKFSSWFGDAEEFELIHSGNEAVADRLHVFYRLRVKKPGNVPKLVEQHLLCHSMATESTLSISSAQASGPMTDRTRRLLADERAGPVN